MTIEELEKKVAAAELKVEKCKKTIERHIAQKDKKADKLKKMGIDPEAADRYSYVQGGSTPNYDVYWLLCEYSDKKDDIKGATDKLTDATRILNNWKEKLSLAIEQDRFLTGNAPKVIVDFLEEWKQNAFEYYKERYSNFLNIRAELREKVYNARKEAYLTLPEYERIRNIYKDMKDDSYITYSFLLNLHPSAPVEKYLAERELDSKTVKMILNVHADAIVISMCEYHDGPTREAWLEKVLEKEKKAKMLDLINRINHVVGSITDAEGLRIKAGNLNGVVLGETGAVRVETIGAGGYNIQCFHYRTLIQDVSEKYKDRKSSLDSKILSAAQIQAVNSGSMPDNAINQPMEL